jgi:hypothetical protein
MLSQKISEVLGTDLVRTYNNLLLYSKKIEEQDFSKDINEDSIV